MLMHFVFAIGRDVLEENRLTERNISGKEMQRVLAEEDLTGKEVLVETVGYYPVSWLFDVCPWLKVWLSS